MNRVHRSQKSKRTLSPSAKSEAGSKLPAQTEGPDISGLWGNIHSNGYDVVIVDAKTTDAMKNMDFDGEIVEVHLANKTRPEYLAGKIVEVQLLDKPRPGYLAGKIVEVQDVDKPHSGNLAGKIVEFRGSGRDRPGNLIGKIAEANVGSEVSPLTIFKVAKPKETQAERLRRLKLARVRKMKAKLILDINTDVGRVTSQTVRDAAAGN